MSRRIRNTAGLDQLGPPKSMAGIAMTIKWPSRPTGWRAELAAYKSGQARRKHKKPITLPRYVND